MGMKSLFLVYLLAIAATAPTFPGGYKTADPSDEGVQRAVSFAGGELNNISNSMYYVKVAEILEASTQVVAGMNYRVTLELVATDCRKPYGAFLSNLECGVLEGKNGKKQICKIVVYEKPWENYMKLTSSHCEDA